MITVVLVVHLLIAASLVGVILVQRSEGGALGGLGGGTFGGLMTARGSANLLTRTTAILAGCFIATSLILALLASHNRSRSSILDTPPAAVPGGSTPSMQPAVPASPIVPTAPASPTVPAAPGSPAVAPPAAAPPIAAPSGRTAPASPPAPAGQAAPAGNPPAAQPGTAGTARGAGGADREMTVR